MAVRPKTLFNEDRQLRGYGLGNPALAARGGGVGAAPGAGAGAGGMTVDQWDQRIAAMMDQLKSLIAARDAAEAKARQEGWAHTAAREAEARQRGQGGDTGGFSATQLANVRNPSDPEVMRATTTAMVNRNRTLRGAGYDPSASYMRYAAPQKEQETDAEYLERVKQGRATYETQQAGIKSRNEERTAGLLRDKAARGAVGSAYGMRNTPGGLETLTQVKGGPIQNAGTFGNLDTARAGAEAQLAPGIDAEEELRRKLAEFVGPMMPRGYGGYGG
jgi:hypothetical protein